MFCLFWLSVSLSTFSQPVLKGKINGLPAGHRGSILLEYWSEDSWKQAANSAFTSDGSFVLAPKVLSNGQYRFRLTSDAKKWGDFVWNASSRSKETLQITLDYHQLNMQAIRLDESPESDAYYKVMTAYADFLLNKDSLARNSRDRLKQEQEFIRQAQLIRSQYPGTYTSEIVIPCIARPENLSVWDENIPMEDVLAKYSETSIQHIPFQDTRILYHFGLVRSLNYHFQYFYEHDRITDYIDQVMTRSLANDTTAAFAFKFVLEKMLDFKSEKGLSYLIESYATDCTDNEQMSETTKNLITALERNKPGNKIENLVLPDTAGRLVDLSGVYAKNKITLLMFWRANCSHCREFEPELEEIYAQYKSKGLEVYAIGTDKEEDQWREQVVMNRSPWPGVFLAYSSRANFSKRFPVPSTPTLIAVDSEGTILRRLIIRSKLREALDEMFREVN